MAAIVFTMGAVIIAVHISDYGKYGIRKLTENRKDILLTPFLSFLFLKPLYDASLHHCVSHRVYCV